MGQIKRVRSKVLAPHDQRAIPKKGKKRKRAKEYTAKRRPAYDTPGRPPYERVEALVPLIKEMVAAGLTKEKIAKLCINPETGKPISVETLEKYYEDALELGLDEANLAMSRSAFAQGVGFPGIPNPNYGLPDKRRTIEGVKNPNFEKFDKRQWLVPPIAPQPTMTIWWEKTRAGKKEGMTIDHTGIPAAQQTIIVLPANGRETGGTPILDLQTRALPAK